MQTWGQIVFSIIGMLIVPIVGFIWAIIEIDTKSFYFWWNIICFGNSMALCITVQGSTLGKLIKMA